LFIGAHAGQVRTPQQERSRATRQRLLEATLECLVEYGWVGTTTIVVAQRAGVSRGAQLHHFPTRASLVLAAVEHLGERRATEIRDEALALPPDARLDRVIDMLVASFTGPLFAAALEVWVAARTDRELRAAMLPLEHRFGREIYRLTVEALGVDDSRPLVRPAVQATLDLLRGLGVANLLSDDSGRRHALLAAWKTQLAIILATPTDPGRPSLDREPDQWRENRPDQRRADDQPGLAGPALTKGGRSRG
jgi:AcrR family transcriptional regulator